MVHDAGPRAGRGARVRRWFPGADLVVFGHSHEPCPSSTRACGCSIPAHRPNAAGSRSPRTGSSRSRRDGSFGLYIEPSRRVVVLPPSVVSSGGGTADGGRRAEPAARYGRRRARTRLPARPRRPAGAGRAGRPRLPHGRPAFRLDRGRRLLRPVRLSHHRAAARRTRRHRHDLRCGRFWARRFRRLLPGVVLLVGFVALLGGLGLPGWTAPHLDDVHRHGHLLLELAPGRRPAQLLGPVPDARAARTRVEPGGRGAVLPRVAGRDLAGGRRHRSWIAPGSTPS